MEGGRGDGGGRSAFESCLFGSLKGSWPRHGHYRPSLWSNIPCFLTIESNLATEGPFHFVK